MRVHNGFEMNNEIDMTVSRLLKNWASLNQPPSNGRECLLGVASLSPLDHQLDKSNILVTLLTFLRDHLFYTDLEIRYQDDWPDGLINRHMTLAFCFSTNWRMAI